MSAQGGINLCWAQTLVDGLVEGGLRQVVISPGSRSTPLVLACERHPAIETWIQIDERCAAFFALGLARADAGRPVALIATSGSAPAHWLPAVIEANHNAIPLILMSADRPPELQGWGANQTVEQSHLFAAQLRQFYALPLADNTKEALRYLRQLARRSMSESRWPLPGPVHLNVPFREPLMPELDDGYVFSSAVNDALQPFPLLMPEPAQLQMLVAKLKGKRGVIIAGPESSDVTHADALLRLAEALQVPLLADPLSDLRFGAHAQAPLLSHYDSFLRAEDFVSHVQPDWILRIGAMPVSKSLAGYLQASAESFTILLDPLGRWRDPQQLSNELVIADVRMFCEQLHSQISTPAPKAWLSVFLQQEHQAQAKLAEAEIAEAQLVNQLLSRLPAGSTLFSSNSMPIRNLDSFSGHADKPLRIVANRGASGIDGNVSTLAGLAANNQKGKLVGLLGDLACYHDMNGLLALRELDVLIIVINNHGGGIFQHLPQAGLPEFERDWQTDPGLDFSRVAGLYDLLYDKVTVMNDFGAKLESMLNQSGARLLEVEIDAADSVAKHRAYWQSLK